LKLSSSNIVAGTGIKIEKKLHISQATVPSATDMYSITYASSLFVAIWKNATIFTSPDGMEWTKQTTNILKNLQGVTYGNGLFEIVGNGGIIVTSANSTTWEVRTSPISSSLYSTAYRSEMFVSVGSGQNKQLII
jgi:hypothetical protein